MRGLKAKRVLITGGASGIGAATAARFLEEGSVVCVLDRDADARKNIERELPSLAAAIPADVSDLKQVQAALTEATRVMGGVDVLINNAGVAPISLLDDLRIEDWEEMIDVNLKGVLYGISAALPVFRRQGLGMS